jgi:hypothetical protein
MPIVLRVKGYRFSFYEADLDDPPHIHVRRQGGEAKFWLVPIKLERSRGFRGHELSEIQRLIEEYIDQLLLAWEEEEAKRGDSEG